MIRRVSGSCLSSCLPSSPTSLEFTTFENVGGMYAVLCVYVYMYVYRREKGAFTQNTKQDQTFFGKHHPNRVIVYQVVSYINYPKKSETKTTLKC